MCPMCIGTATIILSGGGSAGVVALMLGYWARKKHLFRAIMSLGIWRVWASRLGQTS